MSAIFGLLWPLATLGAIASADPVALRLGEVSGGNVDLILPNSGTVQALIIGNVLQLIFFVCKNLWAIWKQKEAKLKKKVDALTYQVQEIKAAINALEKLPDEDAIMERLEERSEFLVFKAVRALERENR